jgi:hypothetical protein
MSELRDMYIQLGSNIEQLETSPDYLADLAIRGATETDNYLLGRNKDFGHVRELAEILKKHQLKDTDDALSISEFPYIPLWRAMSRDGPKKITDFAELALEMRLLRAELGSIPADSNRLEEMRAFLCVLAREFSSDEHSVYAPRRMAS